MLQPQTEPSYTPAEAEIFTMQPSQLGEYWPIVARFLLRFENPDWTLDQVFEDLKDGKAQLWGIAGDQVQGIWITRIEITPRGKYGLVWIAVGSGLERGVPRYLECTESWFREMGCEYIEIVGRKGWARALPGYSLHSVILRKPLHGRQIPQ